MTQPSQQPTLSQVCLPGKRSRSSQASKQAVQSTPGRALSLDAGTDPDTLNADIATDAALGVVKIGDGIDVNADGQISVVIPPGTTISETAPLNPEAGQLWWADTTEDDGGGRLYVWTGTDGLTPHCLESAATSIKHKLMVCTSAKSTTTPLRAKLRLQHPQCWWRCFKL